MADLVKYRVLKVVFINGSLIDPKGRTDVFVMGAPGLEGEALALADAPVPRQVVPDVAPPMTNIVARPNPTFPPPAETLPKADVERAMAELVAQRDAALDLARSGEEAVADLQSRLDAMRAERDTAVTNYNTVQTSLRMNDELMAALRTERDEAKARITDLEAQIAASNAAKTAPKK